MYHIVSKSVNSKSQWEEILSEEFEDFKLVEVDK